MDVPLYCFLMFGIFCWLVPFTSGEWKPIYKEPAFLDMLLSTKQYSLFSNLVGIQDVNLVIPSDRSPELLMYNKDLKYGDILPFPSDRRKKRGVGINFSVYPRYKWDNKTVPFIISTDYTPSQTNTILDKIATFNNLVKGIKFVPREKERDYIFFFKGNGCYSSFGRTGGQQVISFQNDYCLTTRTVLHEMLHCIGILHEHQSPNRDTYVKVLYENIPIEYYTQYDKLQGRDYVSLGTYDYYSIMHYFYRVPNSQKPAFEILMEGIDKENLGGNTLNPEDVKKIEQLYPSTATQ